MRDKTGAARAAVRAAIAAYKKSPTTASQTALFEAVARWDRALLSFYCGVVWIRGNRVRLH